MIGEGPHPHRDGRTMNVLVIGSGGREHSLVWKLRQSPAVKKVFCAPGNGGIGRHAELVPIGAEEIDSLSEFAAREKVDLTVVGPELPLVMGIVDRFEERNLQVFGPNRLAAQLEGSKAFAKELMLESGIPTASCSIFSDALEAQQYVAEHWPCVVKADGLATGKGVFLCETRGAAESAIDDLMAKKIFGPAGDKVVIEEWLSGEEASFMALVDGEFFLPLASSQDHKRISDGDKGPNTGGMGAYSPAPVVTPSVEEAILKDILKPLLLGLKRHQISYRGVLYVGLMITETGPKVLEFNARFGDPECQPIILRLKTDLLSLLMATVDGRLREETAEWSDEASVCVVLASQGYPGPYEKHKTIAGLERLDDWTRGVVFHAGTVRHGQRWLTNGGRVLGVTALGKDIKAAVEEAYGAVGQISWDGMRFRSDIGQKALARISPPERRPRSNSG